MNDDRIPVLVHSGDGALPRQGFSSPAVIGREALHVNRHAWNGKKFIVPVALALAVTPIGGAGGILSSTSRAAERAALVSASLEQNPSGSQQTSPQPPPVPNANSVEQATAKPPQVTYEGGQLTIIAENSSLTEVMKALRTALGADIDLPANFADQRIWVRLGPGPAHRVLRDLLDETEFNYMIQASEDEQDGIRSVLLTPRSKQAGPAGNAGIPERAVNARVARAGSDTTDASDSGNSATPEAVASSDPAPAAPSAPPPAAPSAPAANALAASASLQNAPGSSELSAPPPGSRTDEMIQQLQSMYQQRRQIQIQQNQKPPSPN
jgi:hypothetical protein